MIPSSPISLVASVGERVSSGRRAIAMAGILAAALPLRAASVGLGEITQQSALGQSLRIVVPVTLGAGEDLASECFKLTGAEREGDGVPQLLFARVNVERTPAGARLVVTTSRPVNDPIVRITVQAGCDSAVRREYTLFMDPPAIDAPVVAAATAPPPEQVIAPSPPPSSREGRRAARSQARTTPRAATPSTTASTSGADTDAARKTAPPKGRAVAKAAPVQPPAAATDRPRFSVSSGAPGTPSGKAATEADRERARQERANVIEAETQVLRQRIVELTAMVERMQQELRAQELTEQAAAGDPKPAGEAPATAATPVAVVAPAPSEAAKAVPALASKAPPTPVAADWWDDNAPLIALIVGLGLLSAAGLLWKRRRDAAQDDQWRTAPPVSIRTMPRPDSPTSVLRNPSAGITLAGPDIVAPAGAKSIDIVPVRHAADELAVSELSHVTDEARVFVALGHKDRAIAVLRDHIRGSPRAMPAAWLMLLGLYHSSANRAEFRKLAANFHEHFNVQMPLWEAFGGDELMTGGIEDFPHVEQQIVALWRKPGCRAYLDRLLHDNREGRRNGFPLSTYSDILTLLQVLDPPAEIDIDGDLAADGKLDAKASGSPARPAPTPAGAAPTPARARKPMPPDSAASKPVQQPIRFEIEPPDSRDKKRS